MAGLLFERGSWSPGMAGLLFERCLEFLGPSVIGLLLHTFACETHYWHSVDIHFPTLRGSGFSIFGFPDPLKTALLLQNGGTADFSSWNFLP